MATTKKNIETTEPEVKVRRKRRTKEEIEAAKAMEAMLEISKSTEGEKPKRGRKKKETAEVPVAEKPKRGRKKAAEAPVETTKIADVPVVKPKKNIGTIGTWDKITAKSNTECQLITCKLNVEIELLRESLSMMPATDEILRKYIDSKSPDSPSVADEIAAFGSDEVETDQTTIWPMGFFYEDPDTGILVDKYDPNTPAEIRDLPNDAEGVIIAPFLYDYQMKGAFKGACGFLNRAKNNKSSELKAYKKVIDGNIFILPHHLGFDIPEFYVNENGNTVTTFDENGKFRRKQRPLRISGPNGTRSALASSEVIPAGSTVRFTIGLTSEEYVPYVCEWLDYGLVYGLGQWRNSGYGIFRWRLLDENWNPIT